MSTHREADSPRELLGAYALGAVSGGERAEVERLVLADQDARAELFELQLAVAWLEQIPTRPSPQVWDRIAAEAGCDVASMSPPREPSSHARRARRGGLAAGLVAAAAVLGALVVGPLDDDPRGPSLAEAARAAANAPAARRVELARPDGVRVLEAVVLPDGRGFVLDSSLPPLRAGRTYQLWAVGDRRPRSAGVLGPSPEIAAFRGASGAEALVVTTEPRGGSPTPTGRVIAHGDLPAT